MEDNQDKQPLRVYVYTALVLFGILALIALIYLAAYKIHLPISANQQGVAYFSNYLSAMVAWGFVVSLAMLVYLGIRERQGLPSTAFYIPQILKHMCLVAVTGPTGLAGVNRLLNHNVVTWRWLFDPELRIVELLFYFGVLVTSLWFNGSWVVTANADQRASVRRLIVICSVTECGLVLLLFALYLSFGR